MRAGIIDSKKHRGQRLKEIAEQCGFQATAVETLGNEALDADIILLHVGDEQEEYGDVIAELLDKFQSTAWVVCYYGGSPVTAASVCTSPTVALFKASVGSESPSDAFERVVKKVLAALTQRSSLPKEWLREHVAGFDALLEAKLCLLDAVLRETALPLDDVKRIRTNGAYGDAFDGDAKLIFTQGRDDAARLRQILFHEAPRGHKS